MSTTIRARFRVNGVLVDATTAKLSDAAGAYGVKRADTSAVIVPDGTDMVRESTGVYSHTFTDPAYGLTYIYAVEFLYLDEYKRGQGTILGPTAASGSAVSVPAAAGQYCGSADLLSVKTEQELTQLSDLNGDGSADPDVLARACVNATDLINGYISPRYTIPLATVPALLKTIAVRLAIYYLHMDRNSLTEDINKQYDRDISFLKMVGAGDASLGDPVAAGSGDKSAGARIVADERLFTRDTLEGF